jgi:hypothetical protein
VDGAAEAGVEAVTIGDVEVDSEAVPEAVADSEASVAGISAVAVRVAIGDTSRTWFHLGRWCGEKTF